MHAATPSPRPHVAAVTPPPLSESPSSSSVVVVTRRHLLGRDSSAAAARRRRKTRDQVAAAEGEAGDETGEAPKAEAGAEGGECSITIGSRPWSEVWIDGKNTTKHTPFADYRIPCGKHKLSFKRPDLQIDHSETISVRAGQKFKQSFTLETETPE